jgi:hypothetical protein
MTDIEREMEDQLTIDMAARFAPGQAPRDFDARPKRVVGFIPELGMPHGEATRAAESYKAAPVGPVVGIKHDAGKAPVWQGVFANFPNAMLQVAHVSRYGQTKYPSYQDWQQLPDALNRYRDGLGRHMLEIAAGEQFDAESKLLHAAHFAWNALAVLELQLREVAARDNASA